MGFSRANFGVFWASHLVLVNESIKGLDLVLDINWFSLSYLVVYNLANSDSRLTNIQ